MYDLRAKISIENEDWDIELSQFNKETAWFSVVTKDGATAKSPYGKITLNEMKLLRNALGVMIHSLEKGEE